ncbi:MAG TPA: M48 family metalloprotease [Longimicrobium sp.]
MLAEIILLVAVLALIALAARSMLRTFAELHLVGLERALDGEAPNLPEADADDYGWIHDRLVEAFAAVREGWALDQVRRIDARLQADVPETERLETVILWIPEANAFTMPGRHVYISRRLMERMAGQDEPVAFVIAHEMAHHRLGHVPAQDLIDRVPAPLKSIALDLALTSTRVLHGADREADTDAVALNLCLAAGYDAERCLRAFDVLEELALDWGDTEAVFGPDSAIQSAVDGDPEWIVRAKEWLCERRRGYPPVRERKARLLAAWREVANAA